MPLVWGGGWGADPWCFVCGVGGGLFLRLCFVSGPILKIDGLPSSSGVKGAVPSLAALPSVPRIAWFKILAGNQSKFLSD